MQWFRIANMDCASEEGEIRQALDGMAGIHQLQFRLGARALGIAADAQILPQALAAIRRCGFKPQALPVSAGSAVQVAAGSGGLAGMDSEGCCGTTLHAAQGPHEAKGTGASATVQAGAAVSGLADHADHADHAAAASACGCTSACRTAADTAAGSPWPSEKTAVAGQGGDGAADLDADGDAAQAWQGADVGVAQAWPGTHVGAAQTLPGSVGPDDLVLPPESFWQRWGRLLTALGLALLAELIAWAGGHGEASFGAPGRHAGHVADFGLGTLAGMGLSAAAIALSGFSVYGKGLAALRRGRLNINALMTVAVTGAFLIGQWPEAAMVMALYALAEAIEARAVDRARNAIGSLLALTPDEADVRQPDGHWQSLPVAQVPVGAVVRVRPGGRVPLDGVVLQGQGVIDQSPITGESLPVDKGVGDEVFAGTINQGSLFEIRTTAPASDSMLARIIEAVEQAQASRAPTQRFVDRFAARYTPAVFGLALAVAVLLPWLTDATALQALYQALVLLVIACPCALVISTPVTVVSGLAAAARRGILIKGGIHLEEARRIRAVALDKTGTLTEGRPVLVAVEPLVTDVDETRLRQWAAALAAQSDHPVSRAIAEGLGQGAAGGWRVQDFQALPGRGVQGVVAGAAGGPDHLADADAVFTAAARRTGWAPSADVASLPAADTIVLANHRWIEERGQCSPALEARLAVHEQAGRTVTLLADGQRVLALLAVADTLRPHAAEAVASLRAQGITPVMLTGDNEATARHVAAQAGIDTVRAGLLPEEKLQAIAALKQRHGRVAMVGDGINDAPALARSDLGLAMGAAGTDTAIEAADVLIMNDDLRRLPETIALSHRTHAVLWQNIGLALGIKLAFLLLAVAGQATMWMAVFADMGASLLVVANGLRLLRAGSDQAIV